MDAVAAAVAATSVRSATYGVHAPPAATISDAVRRAIASSRSMIATMAPSAASVCEMARPMFDAPPVTMAMRPSSPRSMAQKLPASSAASTVSWK